MPFDIHPVFLIGLLAVVLIIFGPGKLPQLGGAMGRGIREFRHATSAITEPVSAGPIAADGNEATVPEAAADPAPEPDQD